MSKSLSTSAGSSSKSKFGRNLNAVHKAPAAPATQTRYAAGRQLLVLGKAQKSTIKSVSVAAPVPINTPSLRKENNGQDINVNIVPQGGSGWGQPDKGTDVRVSDNAKATDSPLRSRAVEQTDFSGQDERPVSRDVYRPLAPAAPLTTKGSAPWSSRQNDSEGEFSRRGSKTSQKWGDDIDDDVPSPSRKRAEFPDLREAAASGTVYNARDHPSSSYDPRGDIARPDREYAHRESLAGGHERDRERYSRENSDDRWREPSGHGGEWRRHSSIQEGRNNEDRLANRSRHGSWGIDERERRGEQQTFGRYEERNREGSSRRSYDTRVAGGAGDRDQDHYNRRDPSHFRDRYTADRSATYPYQAESSYHGRVFDRREIQPDRQERYDDELREREPQPAILGDAPQRDRRSPSPIRREGPHSLDVSQGITCGELASESDREKATRDGNTRDQPQEVSTSDLKSQEKIMRQIALRRAEERRREEEERFEEQKRRALERLAELERRRSARQIEEKSARESEDKEIADDLTDQKNGTSLDISPAVDNESRLLALPLEDAQSLKSRQISTTSDAVRTLSVQGSPDGTVHSRAPTAPAPSAQTASKYDNRRSQDVEGVDINRPGHSVPFAQQAPSPGVQQPQIRIQPRPHGPKMLFDPKSGGMIEVDEHKVRRREAPKETDSVALVRLQSLKSAGQPGKEENASAVAAPSVPDMLDHNAGSNIPTAVPSSATEAKKTMEKPTAWSRISASSSSAWSLPVREPSTVGVQLDMFPKLQTLAPSASAFTLSSETVVSNERSEASTRPSDDVDDHEQAADVEIDEVERQRVEEDKRRLVEQRARERQEQENRRRKMAEEREKKLKAAREAAARRAEVQLAREAAAAAARERRSKERSERGPRTKGTLFRYDDDGEIIVADGPDAAKSKKIRNKKEGQRKLDRAERMASGEYNDAETDGLDERSAKSSKTAIRTTKSGRKVKAVTPDGKTATAIVTGRVIDAKLKKAKSSAEARDKEPEKKQKSLPKISEELQEVLKANASGGSALASGIVVLNAAQEGIEQTDDFDGFQEVKSKATISKERKELREKERKLGKSAQARSKKETGKGKVDDMGKSPAADSLAGEESGASNDDGSRPTSKAPKPPPNVWANPTPAAQMLAASSRLNIANTPVASKPSNPSASTIPSASPTADAESQSQPAQDSEIIPVAELEETEAQLSKFTEDAEQDVSTHSHDLSSSSQLSNVTDQSADISSTATESSPKVPKEKGPGSPPIFSIPAHQLPPHLAAHMAAAATAASAAQDGAHGTAGWVPELHSGVGIGLSSHHGVQSVRPAEGRSADWTASVQPGGISVTWGSSMPATTSADSFNYTSVPAALSIANSAMYRQLFAANTAAFQNMQPLFMQPYLGLSTGSLNSGGTWSLQGPQSGIRFAQQPMSMPPLYTPFSTQTSSKPNGSTQNTSDAAPSTSHYSWLASALPEPASSIHLGLRQPPQPPAPPAGAQSSSKPQPPLPPSALSQTQGRVGHEGLSPPLPHPTVMAATNGISATAQLPGAFLNSQAYILNPEAAKMLATGDTHPSLSTAPSTGELSSLSGITYSNLKPSAAIEKTTSAASAQYRAARILATSKNVPLEAHWNKALHSEQVHGPSPGTAPPTPITGQPALSNGAGSEIAGGDEKTKSANTKYSSQDHRVRPSSNSAENTGKPSVPIASKPRPKQRAFERTSNYVPKSGQEQPTGNDVGINTVGSKEKSRASGTDRQKRGGRSERPSGISRAAGGRPSSAEQQTRKKPAQGVVERGSRRASTTARSVPAEGSQASSTEDKEASKVATLNGNSAPGSQKDVPRTTSSHRASTQRNMQGKSANTAKGSASFNPNRRSSRSATVKQMYVAKAPADITKPPGAYTEVASAASDEPAPGS